VLARVWLTGQVHRAIDRPDRPRHAHFSLSYPLVLAWTWKVGTLSQPSSPIKIVAQLWAVLARALIVGGWVRAPRRPRRRLAELILVLTLRILIRWPAAEAGRFLIPLIPCLLIGAVEGLGRLASRHAPTSGARLARSRPRVLAATVLQAVLLPCSGYSLAIGHLAFRRRPVVISTPPVPESPRAPSGPALSCHAIRARYSDKPPVRGSKRPSRNGPAISMPMPAPLPG